MVEVAGIKPAAREVHFGAVQGYGFGNTQAGSEYKLQQLAALSGCVREDVCSWGLIVDQGTQHGVRLQIAPGRRLFLVA